MKLFRSAVFAIAAVVLAGTFAGQAKAQSLVKNARFTLPFEAKWENSTLPPGDYTLCVDRVENGRDNLYRVTLNGAGKKATFVVVRQPGPQAGNQSMLVAASDGESYSIAALHLAKANVVLTFPAVKLRNAVLAKEPEVLRSVPLQIAAK